jgi:predicted Zn-dependent protease
MYLGVSPVVAYANIANMYLSLGKGQEAIDVLRNSLKEHDEPYIRNMLRQLERGGRGRTSSGGLGK